VQFCAYHCLVPLHRRLPKKLDTRIRRMKKTHSLTEIACFAIRTRYRSVASNLPCSARVALAAPSVRQERKSQRTTSYRTLGARTIEIHLFAHIGQSGQLSARHAKAIGWLDEIVLGRARGVPECRWKPLQNSLQPFFSNSATRGSTTFE
jgi:hypothetical protein